MTEAFVIFNKKIMSRKRISNDLLLKNISIGHNINQNQ